MTAPRTGAFELHLREAIGVNRVRSREYSKLTNGRSLSVTVPLIATEYLLIPLARWFDGRAEPHHRAGIPVLHVAFVASVPGSLVANTLSLLLSPAPDPRVRSVVNRQLRRLSRHPAVAAMRLLIEGELLRLTCGATDAMRRRLLESIRRLLTIEGPLDSRARVLQRQSPAPLLHRLVRLHVLSLSWADWLDDRARPLQRRGIPVLVNDLPRIPAWPEEWPYSESA